MILITILIYIPSHCLPTLLHALPNHLDQVLTSLAVIQMTSRIKQLLALKVCQYYRWFFKLNVILPIKDPDPENLEEYQKSVSVAPSIEPRASGTLWKHSTNECYKLSPPFLSLFFKFFVQEKVSLKLPWMTLKSLCNLGRP